MPNDYIPKPRECATLAAVGRSIFLIGGNSQTTVKEMLKARLEGEHLRWQLAGMKHPPSLDVPAKQMHSCVAYKHFLYIFGGCFAFNKLRNTRESTNSIFEYNTET